MRAFFIQKCFAQLFSSYVLAKKALSYKKTRTCNVDEIDTRSSPMSGQFYCTYLLPDYEKHGYGGGVSSCRKGVKRKMNLSVWCLYESTSSSTCGSLCPTPSSCRWRSSCYVPASVFWVTWVCVAWACRSAEPARNAAHFFLLCLSLSLLSQTDKSVRDRSLEWLEGVTPVVWSSLSLSFSLFLL